MVRRAVAEGVILEPESADPSVPKPTSEPRSRPTSGPVSRVRTTGYDLVLARFNPEEASEGTSGGPPIWVSVDTRYPNRLFGQALRRRMLPEFRQYDRVEAEYWYHKLSPWKEEAEVAAAAKPRSRMDFYLEGGLDEASKGSGSSYGCEARDARGTGLPPALVEVKSVTLCRGGVGLFPDAPTERGARHLRELIRGAKEGYRAYAVFIAQREDIGLVRPNREMDRTFADALREAQASGVSLLAFRCSVSPYEIRLDASAISVDPG